MAAGNGTHTTEVQRLRDIAWEAIGTATVDGAVRDRYWQAWTGHYKLFPLNDRGPNHPPHNIEDMLLTFAVAVREGKYSRGGCIQVQSVSVALCAVAQNSRMKIHPRNQNWPSRCQPFRLLSTNTDSAHTILLWRI
jgi:hypothetical protein